jgi:hypothetical protein
VVAFKRVLYDNMCILRERVKNMIISTQVARAFNKAVTSTENLSEECINLGPNYGTVIWGYVYSDVIKAMLGKVPDNYAEQFDYLADCYTGNITPADRIEQLV